jgi:hypothetical protein
MKRIPDEVWNLSRATRSVKLRSAEKKGEDGGEIKLGSRYKFAERAHVEFIFTPSRILNGRQLWEDDK